MATISVGADDCRSIFRLLGRNEDALTYALGYLLARDAELLVSFLKTAGVLNPIRGKRYARELENVRIVLQERRNTGRTDLVIHWPAVRVIVEAKVGRGQPSSCQLLHYTTGCDVPGHRGRPDPSPWIDVDRRFIVTLTTGSLDAQTQRTVAERLHSELHDDYAGVKLLSMTWEDVYRVVRHRADDPLRSPSQSWALNEFMTFFREDYEMPYYDAEVLIQDIFGDQYGVFADFHMYRRDCRGPSAPLYFAPYHTHGGGGISSVARCLRVIDDRVDSGLVERMQSALSTAPKFNEQWGHWRSGLEFVLQSDSDASPMMRFFFLDDPQPLGKQVRKKTGMTMLPVGYKKTFQALLRDNTL